MTCTFVVIDQVTVATLPLFELHGVISVKSSSELIFVTFNTGF